MTAIYIVMKVIYIVMKTIYIVMKVISIVMKVIYVVIKVITLSIYHDFLPPPRRGSHAKSDNTHTIINIHPLAHILDICALIFSSCAPLTVYPNCIM